MKMTGKLLLAAVAVAGFSGSAMAADLYVAPTQSAPAYVPPASSDWDGPYIGAQLGYGWGYLAAPTSSSSSGWIVGGQVGYNFHLSDNIVTGVEADLAWNHESSADIQYNWDASVRGRLGVDLDGILPYAEAGVAFANATPTAAASTTYTGWTAGAGIEFKVADPVSVNVEYRYSDYGTSGGATPDLTDNSARLGLNYHF